MPAFSWLSIPNERRDSALTGLTFLVLALAVMPGLSAATSGVHRTSI
jgi:hypothetical protein